MTNAEILSFEYQRRELVQLLLTRNINGEQLNALHALDKKIAGYDLVGICYDEIAALTKERDKYKKALQFYTLFHEFGETARKALDSPDETTKEIK